MILPVVCRPGPRDAYNITNLSSSEGGETVVMSASPRCWARAGDAHALCRRHIRGRSQKDGSGKRAGVHHAPGVGRGLSLASDLSRAVLRG